MLIGRIKEKTELFETGERAAAGQGSIVLIGGETGIGKTAIAEVFIKKSGLLSVKTRSNEGDSSSYSLIKSVLREIIKNDSFFGADDGPLCDYLNIILPERGVPPSDSSADNLTEAILSVFFNAAGIKPLLIFVDDLHWCDNASLELIGRLSHKISNHSLLVMCTYCDDEITRGHKIKRIKNDIRRARVLTEIILKPLNAEETKLMIEDIIGKQVSSNTADTIYSQTQGIPLFIEEFIISIEDKITGGAEIRDNFPIPESVKEIIAQHFFYLSGDAVKFLRAAAILGNQFDIKTAAELSGAKVGVDELFERRLLFETGLDQAVFKNTLIRETVIEDITWSLRKDLHREAAELLLKKNAAPEIIADHFLHAGETEKARYLLIQGIEDSCRLYAFNDAAEKANTVLNIWPEGEEEKERLRVLFEYAHCCQINGRLNESLRALKEIIQSRMFSHDIIFGGEVFRLMSMVYGFMGRWSESAGFRDKAGEAFLSAGNYDAAASEFLISAGRKTAMLKLNDALKTSRHAAESADKAGLSGLKSRAVALSGNLLAMQGKFREGEEVVREALRIALENNDLDAASEIYRRLASTLEYASEYNAAKTAYLNAYNFCVSTGADVNAQVCLGCMSYIFFQTGEWKDSLDICRKVIANESTPLNSAAVGYGITGLISALRGEVRKAEKNLHKSIEISKRNNLSAVEMLMLWGKAVLNEYRNNPDGEGENYHEIIEMWHRIEDYHDVIPALMWASRYFAKINSINDSVKCVDILSRIASATGNQEAMAALAFSIAEASVLNKNYEEAVMQYKKSIEHLDRLNIPLEKLLVEFRLGELNAVLNNRQEAADRLNNVYRTALNFGMRPFAVLVSSAMEKIGVSAGERRSTTSSARSTKGGLTGRQYEILLYLSEGLSNKEIAVKTFLSTRTVDMHVSNILIRFNCRSRTEAVSKAREIKII